MLERLSDIPDKPGVYMFKDENKTVLYVGKAKGLRSRVRSYFQKSSHLDERKAAMVKIVKDFEYTVTGNELEAFVLEANLIKQFRPRYNILLRDDKSYPYLKLTLSEQWPRLEVVRRIKKDGSKYYGPYVPSGDMWNILSFIRNTFKLPTCHYSFDRRIRPCIQHQIQKCSAPCDGRIDHDEYMKMIHEIRLLLEGKNRNLLDFLGKRMQGFSDELRFEEAAVLRDRINAIQKISESQKVVAPELGDVDVIGLCREAGRSGFKLLFIRNGIMTGYRQFELEHTLGETDQGLMKSFIEQFYMKEILPPHTIICSVLPEDREILSSWLSAKRDTRVFIALPERGIKRELVAMAVENAAMLLKTGQGKDKSGLEKEIAELLGLLYPPVDIGAFDISNISGSEPVGAFVYWTEGSFRKDYYRHIRMDAVEGPDDYAMMREMVRRTLGPRECPQTAEDAGRAAECSGQSAPPAAPEKNAEHAGVEIPDLIIIDGGKGHLEAALQTMNAVGIKTNMISIAKDPDRAFIPGREAPVVLDDGRRASLLLKRIRDEVHRFAIRYHKKRRARRMLESPLEKIPGIGRKRRLELLRHFGSLEGIRKATYDEIAQLKGFNRPVAELLVKSLNK